MDATVCFVCAKPCKSRCSRCSSVYFCSRECQITGIKTHTKAACLELRKERENALAALQQMEAMQAAGAGGDSTAAAAATVIPMHSRKITVSSLGKHCLSNEALHDNDALETLSSKENDKMKRMNRKANRRARRRIPLSSVDKNSMLNTYMNERYQLFIGTDDGAVVQSTQTFINETEKRLLEDKKMLHDYERSKLVAPLLASFKSPSSSSGSLSSSSSSAAATTVIRLVGAPAVPPSMNWTLEFAKLCQESCMRASDEVMVAAITKLGSFLRSFSSFAQYAAECIIAELELPNAFKTIVPCEEITSSPYANMNYQSTVSYIHGGVQFFVVDSAYSLCPSSLEPAVASEVLAKHASNALLSVSAIQTHPTLFDHQMLGRNLAILMNVRGYNIYAVASDGTLEVGVAATAKGKGQGQGQGELVQGWTVQQAENDKGEAVTTDERPQFLDESPSSRILQCVLSEAFNLKPKRMSSNVDGDKAEQRCIAVADAVAFRVMLDQNRVFFLKNMSRLLPPAIPAAFTHSKTAARSSPTSTAGSPVVACALPLHQLRRLRPEFMRVCPVRLSSDAFSQFDLVDALSSEAPPYVAHVLAEQFKADVVLPRLANRLVLLAALEVADKLTQKNAAGKFVEKQMDRVLDHDASRHVFDDADGLVAVLVGSVKEQAKDALPLLDGATEGKLSGAATEGRTVFTAPVVSKLLHQYGVNLRDMARVAQEVKRRLTSLGATGSATQVDGKPDPAVVLTVIAAKNVVTVLHMHMIGRFAKQSLRRLLKHTVATTGAVSLRDVNGETKAEEEKAALAEMSKADRAKVHAVVSSWLALFTERQQPEWFTLVWKELSFKYDLAQDEQARAGFTLAEFSSIVEGIQTGWSQLQQQEEASAPVLSFQGSRASVNLFVAALFELGMVYAEPLASVSLSSDAPPEKPGSSAPSALEAKVLALGGAGLDRVFIVHIKTKLVRVETAVSSKETEELIAFELFQRINYRRWLVSRLSDDKVKVGPLSYDSFFSFSAKQALSAPNSPFEFIAPLKLSPAQSLPSSCLPSQLSDFPLLWELLDVYRVAGMRCQLALLKQQQQTGKVPPHESLYQKLLTSVLQRGKLLLGVMSDIQSSLAAAKKISLTPLVPAFHEGAGTFLQSLGMYPQSITEFEKQVTFVDKKYGGEEEAESSEEVVAALFNLSSAYSLTEQWKSKLRVLERALKAAAVVYAAADDDDERSDDEKDEDDAGEDAVQGSATATSSLPSASTSPTLNASAPGGITAHPLHYVLACEIANTYLQTGAPGKAKGLVSKIAYAMKEGMKQAYPEGQTDHRKASGNAAAAEALVDRKQEKEGKAVTAQRKKRGLMMAETVMPMFLDLTQKVMQAYGNLGQLGEVRMLLQDVLNVKQAFVEFITEKEKELEKDKEKQKKEENSAIEKKGGKEREEENECVQQGEEKAKTATEFEAEAGSGAKAGEPNPANLSNVQQAQLFLASSYLEMAGVMEQMQDFPGIAKMMHSAIPLYSTCLGPAHGNVGICLEMLGTAQMETKDTDQALDSLEKALAIQERIFGKKHVIVASIDEKKAMLYAEKKDPHKQASLLERAYDVYEALMPNSKEIQRVLTALGEVYGKLQHTDKQLQVLERSVQMRRADKGDNHPALAIELTNLANCYGAAKRYDLQLKTLQEALSMKAKHLPPVHVQMGIAHLSLAQAYQGLRQPQSMEQHLIQAKDILTKVHGGEEHPRAELIKRLFAAHVKLERDIKREQELAQKEREAKEREEEMKRKAAKELAHQNNSIDAVSAIIASAAGSVATPAGGEGEAPFSSSSSSSAPPASASPSSSAASANEQKSSVQKLLKGSHLKGRLTKMSFPAKK